MELYLTIGLVQLGVYMLPGADFSVVAKNAIFRSREHGIAATFGIVTAIIIHLSFCIFGGIFLFNTYPFIINLIKYIGAGYLLYLSYQAYFVKTENHLIYSGNIKTSKLYSYREGFFCNLLNPKAVLFFISLFSLVFDQQTPLFTQLLIGLEIILLGIVWFGLVSIIITMPSVKPCIDRLQVYISKILSALLFLCAIFLIY